MEPTKKRQSGELAQLRQARQEALDSLFKARLEGHQGPLLTDAVERAQRAADALFAALLREQNQEL